MSEPATIPGARHRRAAVNGTELHYVELGDAGPPILLVHGFPETWWAFNKIMPLLAERHRVIAVDLRGFGDSSCDVGPFDRETVAEDLRQLIEVIGYGPVHITGQDLGAPSVYTLAARHPELIRSLTLIEAGLHGFGLERAMNVAEGGAWFFGFFASDYAEVLVRGHERELISGLAYRDHVDDRAHVSDADVAEFVRTYSRPNGFRGTHGLYASHVNDKVALRKLGSRPLRMPVLAVNGTGRTGSGTHTGDTARQIARDVVTHDIETGHFIAQEQPVALAEAWSAFISGSGTG